MTAAHTPRDGWQPVAAQVASRRRGCPHASSLGVLRGRPTLERANWVQKNSPRGWMTRWGLSAHAHAFWVPVIHAGTSPEKAAPRQINRQDDPECDAYGVVGGSGVHPTVDGFVVHRFCPILKKSKDVSNCPGLVTTFGISPRGSSHSSEKWGAMTMALRAASTKSSFWPRMGTESFWR